MADASSSKMIQYCQSKGWGFKESGDQIILDKCPYCGAKEHFYAAVGGNKDGLNECKKCMKSGNLYQLRVDQGDRDPNMTSQKDWAGSDKTEALPEADRCHEALLGDESAIDYLMNVRGFSMETIRTQKLGLVPNRYFRDLNKETKAIVIPFLKDGRPVYCKYRSFFPDSKAFASPTGWEAPLYNQEIIKPGVDELLFVEGEYDALSCMSQGVKNVLGVPGASLKKTTWVDLIDEVKPEKIYILYDRDRAGQKGAQELAERIGLDRCYSIKLPDFTFVTDEGEEKTGKDVNDWFRHGEGTLEKFEELKKAARKFDVRGVMSLGSALEDLERSFEGKEKDEATYITQWDSLNFKIGGFEPGDVVDIIAPGKIGKSTFALNLIDDLVARYGEPGMFICGEMTQARLARKWMSMVTKTDDSPAKSDADKIEKAKRLKAAIPIAKDIIRAREGEMYFSYPMIQDLDELYELMRQAKRRYGIRFMVLDNLQLFCDNTLKNPAHRTIHLSQLSKKVTAIAKELGYVLFRIVQPRGINEDKIASATDADGSSQISKDCDLTMGLHRTKKAKITAGDFEAMGGFMDEEEAFEPNMLVDVGMSRYSPGGKTTMSFDGATSSVSELDRTQTAAPRPTSGTYSSPGVLPTERKAAPSHATAILEQEVSI